MDAINTDAYLRRIDATRPATPDADALRELCLRHLRAVPFENLSIHLGEEIVLDGKALVDKIVHGRRGGFCYELNGAFAQLLTALGYPVTLLSGRVMGEEGLGVPYDHLVLRVETPEPWLVDVGFGRNSHYPLSLTERGDQSDPAGVFRIAETEEGDVDVFHDGVLQYRIEQRPRQLAEFECACWWHRTSPKSHFTQNLVCSRLTENGRVTISDRTLVITGASGRRDRTLTEDEILPAYRTHFGIDLDEVPELRATR